MSGSTLLTINRILVITSYLLISTCLVHAMDAKIKEYKDANIALHGAPGKTSREFRVRLDGSNAVIINTSNLPKQDLTDDVDLPFDPFTDEERKRMKEHERQKKLKERNESRNVIEDAAKCALFTGVASGGVAVIAALVTAAAWPSFLGMAAAVLAIGGAITYFASSSLP